MSVPNRGPGNWQPGRSAGSAGAGGARPAGQPASDFTPPSDGDLQAIIQQGDAEKLVKVAEQVGKVLARPQEQRDQLTTSQIRGVFGAVRQIEMSWPHNGQQSAEAQTRARRCQRQLLLLKPKLAYQARRAQGQGVERLRRVLDPAIGLVGGDRERFQHFVEFFEAILAYHRAYGGQ